MGFNCGIVGLPNVGKSTIFNAITAAGAEASNYPFCTIEPNIGMVTLNDERMDELSKIVNPEKIQPTTVEFVDIAGLVKGASKGEGLGNQFLGNIRSVAAIIHVVRCFEDTDVVHVEGKVDPLDDISTINTELIFADLDSVEKRIEKNAKKAKSGDKDAVAEMKALEEAKNCLEQGSLAKTLSDETKELLSDLNLITAKPVLYAANVSEDDLEGKGELAQIVKDYAEKEASGFVVISGKVESELAELEEDEKQEFLESLGLSESGLEKLAREAFKLLGLITYFTAGVQEVRAWTIKAGTLAPGAAGVIHTDFERGFIRAEVMAYSDFVENKGEAGCKEKGLLKVEGKEYLVKDGDVMHFRFNV